MSGEETGDPFSEQREEKQEEKDPRDIEIIDQDQEIDFNDIKGFILNNLVTILFIILILIMIMVHNGVIDQCNSYYQNIINNDTFINTNY